MMTGKFLWYELMTTDTTAAKEFYSKVIGWQTEKFKSMDYELWKMGDRPRGGLIPLTEKAREMNVPPHWMPYIGSEDLHATIEQATKDGAEVLIPPTDIPDGSFGLLKDPQGGIFGIMSSTEKDSPDAKSEIGEFSWHELATTDYEAAWEFYHKLFGWKMTQDIDMNPEVYRLFMAAEHTGGGFYNKPAEMPGSPFWMGYIRVKNLDEAVKNCRKMGGKVLNGPMEVPGGDRVAQCMDPQGAAFSLHEVIT